MSSDLVKNKRSSLIHNSVFFLGIIILFLRTIAARQISSGKSFIPKFLITKFESSLTLSSTDSISISSNLHRS